MQKERMGYNQDERSGILFDLNNFFVHLTVIAKRTHYDSIISVSVSIIAYDTQYHYLRADTGRTRGFNTSSIGNTFYRYNIDGYWSFCTCEA